MSSDTDFGINQNKYDWFPVWKKSIGKYWIQYFFREFPILYREKSIRFNTYEYFFFISEFSILKNKDHIRADFLL